MKLIHSFDRTLKFFDRCLKYFAGLLMLFIVISISVSVITRYFFNIPLAWTVEVNEYIMIYITFLTIAWTLHHDGHVQIEIVLNKLKPKTKKIVNACIYTLLTIIFLIVFWYGLNAVIDLYQRNVVKLQVLQTPRYITFLPICIGSLLFALRSFLKIFDKADLLNRDVEREEMS